MKFCAYKAKLFAEIFEDLFKSNSSTNSLCGAMNTNPWIRYCPPPPALDKVGRGVVMGGKNSLYTKGLRRGEGDATMVLAIWGATSVIVKSAIFSSGLDQA